MPENCEPARDVYGQLIDGLECLPRTGFDVWDQVLVGMGLIVLALLILSVTKGSERR